VSLKSGVNELPGAFCRSFAADVSAPHAARCALQALRDHVDEELLERGGIVVSELVTNSVRHARLAPEQLIDLRISARRELLRVELSDDGDGFSPVAMRPHPHQPAGGWGLWIVAELADRWGVDVSHSTRVWCEFEPRAEPEPRLHELNPASITTLDSRARKSASSTKR
jgi:anti-sigma regulatory factor (Ser/Thr protein kinase)